MSSAYKITIANVKKNTTDLLMFFEARSLKLNFIFSFPNTQKSFTHIQSFTLDLLTLFADNWCTQEQKFTVKKKNLLQQNNKKSRKGWIWHRGKVRVEIIQRFLRCTLHRTVTLHITVSCTEVLLYFAWLKNRFFFLFVLRLQIVEAKLISQTVQWSV